MKLKLFLIGVLGLALPALNCNGPEFGGESSVTPQSAGHRAPVNRPETNKAGEGRKKEIDMKIQAFLEKNRNNWRDWNVPYEDGQELHNLIVKNNFKSALEIGTSSGHSTIWLAKAMNQTGGKVTTIEIDPGRYNKALENFEAAGVAHLIHTILGDAHQEIPKLTQKFDFVFSDATFASMPDDGYLNFFKALQAKLTDKGCFTMHNVLDGYGDDGHFLKYVRGLPGYTTRIIKSSGAGISVSCK